MAPPPSAASPAPGPQAAGPAPDAQSGSARGAPPAGVDVTVVLVHFRTPDLLRDCLATIAAAGTRARVELLIVDNDPLDDAAAGLAARHQARYLRNERNVGYGRAVNQGLEEGRGRHFLILNPDIAVRPGAIDALVEFMDRHPAVGVAGPKLFSPDGTLQFSARTFYTLPIILLRRTPLGRLWPNARLVREHLMMDWDHRDVREVDWLLGGALIVRRAAVADVGGMDERFFLYFEDVDWCSRMHRRGWRVVYVPAAEMVHAHQRASARGFLTRGQRLHLESALRFYEKWSLLLYLWKRQATGIRATATLLTDLVLLSAAFLAAYFTRYVLGLAIPGWSEARPVLALRVYSRFIPFADLVAIGTFSFLGLYRGEVWRDRWRELLQLAKGMLITSVVVLATTFLTTTRPLSRFTVVIFFAYGLIFVALGREVLRRLVAGVRERRIQLRRLAVLASRAQIAELKGRFARHGFFGYEPVYLAHEDEPGRPGGTAESPEERRLRLLEEERVAEAVVFESAEQTDLVARLLPRLMASGLPVTYVPIAARQVTPAARVRDFMGFGALSLERPAARRRGWAKRLVDLGLACGLLVLGLPAHLLQLIVSGGRGVTRVSRIGRAGRPLALPCYARSTALLRALPALGLYPSLASVLRGEMSFVGLVPLTPEEWAAADAAYRHEPPDAPVGILDPLPGHLHSRAGAGIAAEVSGYAGERLEALLAWNRHYLDHGSPAEDLRVLARVLRGRGPREEPSS